MLDTTLTHFRDATNEDLPRLVDLGRRFFGESHFPEFTEFDPDSFEDTLRAAISAENTSFTVFCLGGEVQGFVIFMLDKAYTKDPLALLYLLYVVPEFRKSPAGRLLVQVAVDLARSAGAKVFYAGAMSGIPGTQKSLANMYRKLGFKDTDFWGMKLL